MANASTPQLVKLRESSARRAAGQALTEQDKLNSTRRQHGLSRMRLVYSANEVRELRRAMRREFAAEMQRMIEHFMCPSQQYQRMAQMAMRVKRPATETLQDRAARDWRASVAAANEIVRAGKKRRSEEN
jgi:hypothetical protein